MYHERNINNLILIIERLEINTREHDSELSYARQIIETLRSKQEEEKEPPSAYAKTTAVAEETSQQDRSRDIIEGVGIHVGNWIKVLNPRAGQPKEGVTIGKTKDNLIKVEERVTVVK